MYVCLCRGVTDRMIRQAVEDGASSLREVHSQLGTASQCGKCGMTTRTIVKEALAQQEQTSSAQFYSAS